MTNEKIKENRITMKMVFNKKLTESKKSCKKHCQMKESVEDAVSWNVNDNGLLSIYIGDWKVADLTDCGDMSYEQIEDLVDDVLYDMGYNWKEDGTVERINESTKTRFPMKEGKGYKPYYHKSSVEDTALANDISNKTLLFLAKKIGEQLDKLGIKSDWSVEKIKNGSAIGAELTDGKNKAKCLVKVGFNNKDGFYFVDLDTHRDWTTDEIRDFAVALKNKL